MAVAETNPPRPASLSSERARSVGSYKLGRRLGIGGMATVYAARQTMALGNTRIVALKLLHDSTLAENEAIDQFRREAMLSTRLTHANIVRTYEVGIHEGRPFMAMELVDGLSLTKLAGGPWSSHGAEAPPPMPVPIACRILDDILSGLHYAHEFRNIDGTLLGLVHQDVSPHNVLVGFDGISRLLDFGVARLSLVDTSRTESVRGKPAYLAPEQLRGARLDRRVDVFAAGVVLHEALSGKRLFKRDTIDQTYMAVLSVRPPSLLASRSDVSRQLDELLQCALAKEPDRRFPSAGAMREAVVRTLSISHHRIASQEEVARWLTTNHERTFELAEMEREILDAGAIHDAPAITLASALDVTASTDPGAALRKTEIPATVRESSVAPPTIPAIPLTTLPLPTVRAPTPGPLQGSGQPDESPAQEPSFHVPLQRSWPRIVAPLGIAAAVAIALVWQRKPKEPVASASPSVSVPMPASVPGLASLSAPSLAPPAASEAASADPPRPERHASRVAPVKHAAAPADPAPTPAPSPPPPPAPAADPAPALKIWSNVSGTVYVDGVNLGPSPLTHTVTPGRHTVVIKSEAGERSKTIDVPATGTVQERFVF